MVTVMHTEYKGHPIPSVNRWQWYYMLHYPGGSIVQNSETWFDISDRSPRFPTLREHVPFDTSSPKLEYRIANGWLVLLRRIHCERARRYHVSARVWCTIVYFARYRLQLCAVRKAG